MYYQPRGRADKPFPVADEFFPQPLLLSAPRLDALRAEASKELQKALRECASYQRARGTYLVNSPPWRAHAEADGLNAYQRAHKTRVNTSVSHVFGTVDGHYRELAQVLHADTRKAYFNVQKTLFPYTVDAAVLHSEPQRADAGPLAFEGVKWAVYEPFALRFRMDACVFESSGEGVDASGRPFAFRVLLPAAFPEVPDLFKSKRTQRVECKSVMLLLPSQRSGNNATELFMTMRTDFKSNTVPRSFYKRFLQSLQQLHTSTGATSAKGSIRKPSYVLSTTAGGQREWALTQARSDCNVCTRPFTVLRAKRRCCVCGAAVCRKCLVRSRDVLPQAPPMLRPEDRSKASSSRLCTLCIQHLREDHEEGVTTPILGGPGSDGSNRSRDTGDDIWTKSQSIHKPLRMSEAPTDSSNSEISASLRSVLRLSATGSDSDASSVNYDETDDEADDDRGRPARFSSRPSVRFSSLSGAPHRLSSASSRSSIVSLTSPIAVVGAPNEQIEYIDDEDVIYEEDPEMLSQRSAAGAGGRAGGDSVVLTLDTSEMRRVRDDSVVSGRSRGLSNVSASTGSPGSGGIGGRSLSVASSASEEVFQSISSSLQEQELLLRQLQAAAARSARGGSVVSDGAVR